MHPPPNPTLPNASWQPMPLSVMFFAWAFCTVNGYLQVRYLTFLYVYPDEWLYDPRFIVGVAIFLFGWCLNYDAGQCSDCPSPPPPRTRSRGVDERISPRSRPLTCHHQHRRRPASQPSQTWRDWVQDPLRWALRVRLGGELLRRDHRVDRLRDRRLVHPVDHLCDLHFPQYCPARRGAPQVVSLEV